MIRTEKGSMISESGRYIIVRIALICLLNGFLAATLSGVLLAQVDHNSSVAQADAGLPFAARTAEPLTLTSQVYLPMIARNYPHTPVFGVQMYGSLSAGTGFTRVVESKASWVRFPVYWARIEPQNTSPDQYNWSGLDASLRTAYDAGVEVLLTIDANPSWAAATASGPVTNTADLIEFVAAVAQRYPFIHYIELYNEPDSIMRYGFRGIQYASMLKAVYPAIKTANPAAQITLGGLALDWFTDQGGPFDRNFLKDVLVGCGAVTCFDVANFHYYSYYRPSWETYGRDIIGKTNYVHQILASHNFVRPIIVSETDWPSGLSWSNPELAARYVTKVYARGIAAGLRAVIWFAMLDATPGAPGLLDNTTMPGSLIPRPSYDAFRVAVQLLGDARYVRTIAQTATDSRPIEGYQFATPDGQRLDVYWYECASMATQTPPQDCDGVAPLKVAATRIAKIDKFGNAAIVTDEDDGYRDGLITLGVLSSPIYIDYTP
jgi:hypothetical protein